MEDEKIRQLFEEIDPEGKIPSEKIDELISVMQEQEKNPLKDGDKIGDYTISIGSLKEKMENETDWKKKAVLAAKIISFNLDL